MQLGVGYNVCMLEPKSKFPQSAGFLDGLPTEAILFGQRAPFLVPSVNLFLTWSPHNQYSPRSSLRPALCYITQLKTKPVKHDLFLIGLHTLILRMHNWAMFARGI